MIVTRDKIYILDSYVSQQIFVFDKTGKLLYRIKNRGRGPQEYLSVGDMQVDTLRNEILVNDALARSYLYFSTDDGSFLRREKGVGNCYLARMDSLYINLTGIGQDFNDKENWEILVSDKGFGCLQRIRPFAASGSYFHSQQFYLRSPGKSIIYTYLFGYGLPVHLGIGCLPEICYLPGKKYLEAL